MSESSGVEATALGGVVRLAEASVQQHGLVLYHFPSCPFCFVVGRSANQLRLNLELRDIHREPGALRELVQATGRSTVPVLRILRSDAEPQWLPESTDILEYLERVARQVQA